MRLFLLATILFCSRFAVAQITFQNNFGTDTLLDEGNSVVQVADSSYYVAGYKVSYTSPVGNGVLLHADKYGNEVWTKYYSVTGASHLYFDCITKTSDGNLVVSGMVYYNVNDFDAYLAKLDTAGNIMWEKMFGSSTRQRGSSVKETFDHGFIICGYDDSVSSGDADVYVVKTDSLGDSLWSKTYVMDGDQFGQSVEQTSDSGYVIAGSHSPVGSVLARAYVIKTNQWGDTAWTRIVNPLNTGQAVDVKAIGNGHSVITGSVSPQGTTAPKPYLLELDGAGNTVWFETYNDGPNGHGYSLDRTTDGGYIVAGRDTSGNFYIVKTDDNGGQQWFQKIDETNSDWGYCIRQTSDGGYIMSGTIINDSTNLGNISLIKLDGNGTLKVTSNAESGHSDILVYPNPARGFVIIRNNTGEKVSAVRLLDVSGKLIQNYSSDPGIINTTTLAKGTYFLVITTGTQTSTFKLSVE